MVQVAYYPAIHEWGPTGLPAVPVKNLPRLSHQRVKGRACALRPATDQSSITFVQRPSFRRATCPAHWNFRLEISSTQFRTPCSRLILTAVRVDSACKMGGWS